MRDELNFRAAAIADEKAYEILLDHWVIPTLHTAALSFAIDVMLRER